MSIKRILTENIKRALKNKKSVLLLGPRQTGKTTLVDQFNPDLNITFLSNRIRQEYEKNPDLILKEVKALKKKERPLIIIDEVQKVPAIMDSIQLLIDKKEAQFIITGSSARKLKQQSDLNLLPGRIIFLRLDGISIEEYQQNELDDLLYYGSLPEVLLTEDNIAKEDLLKSYVEVYLEEEIRKEARLRNIPDFYRFLELTAQHDGKICSYSGIAQDVGVSRVTVKSYYEILESTLIADRIEPITESKTRKKLIRSPRYLFFDLGVRRFAAREGAPLPKTNLGVLFENFVGLEILKLLRTHKLNASLHFWQDPEVADVDWVIKTQQTYIPIEVKKKTTVGLADYKHLKKFLNEYHCPHGGFVIFEGRNLQKIDPEIQALPWQKIPELLKLLNS